MSTRPLVERLERVQQLLYVLGEDAGARDVAEAIRVLSAPADGTPRVYVRVATDEITTADGRGAHATDPAA